ncbi:MAG: TIGR03032 family protein [Panacagrimonas sp.]
MSTPPAPPAPPAPLSIDASRHFPAWMAEQRVSLALSCYQSGKLFLIGLKPDGQLSAFERTFNRCMGLWSDTQTLWLASAYQLWRLENALPPGEHENGFDRVFVPRVGYTTGDVDVHDVAVDADGKLVFVSTLFSCLGTLSERHNFSPLWKPRFVSKLAAEDRCHLNGLAMDNGRPRYATACSQSDVADGWRERRRDGGCVIDIASNEIVASGFSMPHSPRVRDGKLWLLNSGNGDFGYVDPAIGRFEAVAFCPGYGRGLAFAGNNAVIGLSKARHDKTFAGLALHEHLAAKNASARCGVQVVDLKSGDTPHWLRIEGAVEEIYDLVVLPGVLRPKALGFKTEEIRHRVWLDVGGRVQQWSGQARE